MKLPSERVQFILKFVFPSSHDWRVLDRSLNYYYRPRLWKFFELFYLTCLSDWICFFLYIYNDLNGPIGLAVTAYFFSIFGHTINGAFNWSLLFFNLPLSRFLNTFNWKIFPCCTGKDWYSPVAKPLNTVSLFGFPGDCTLLLRTPLASVTNTWSLSPQIFVKILSLVIWGHRFPSAHYWIVFGSLVATSVLLVFTGTYAMLVGFAISHTGDLPAAIRSGQRMGKIKDLFRFFPILGVTTLISCLMRSFTVAIMMRWNALYAVIFYFYFYNSSFIWLRFHFSDISFGDPEFFLIVLAPLSLTMGRVFTAGSIDEFQNATNGWKSDGMWTEFLLHFPIFSSLSLVATYYVYGYLFSILVAFIWGAYFIIHIPALVWIHRSENPASRFLSMLRDEYKTYRNRWIHEALDEIFQIEMLPSIVEEFLGEGDDVPLAFRNMNTPHFMWRAFKYSYWVMFQDLMGIFT